jgi:hypothetical protein
LAAGKNFGHSHYFPIEAGFTAFKKDSCHTKVRESLANLWIDLFVSVKI